MRRSLGIALTSVALWLLCANALHAREPASSLTAVPGRPPAPDLLLQPAEGANLRLSDLRGKVVVVNFWATWCPPCKREMPALERLNERLRGEPFAIVGIDAGEGPEDVLGFRMSTGKAPSFRLFLDRKGDALRAFAVKGLPTTFVLDREGRIAYQALGARKYDDPAIVGEIRSLLRSPASERAGAPFPSPAPDRATPDARASAPSS